MPVQNWSEDIVLADLHDDPSLSDDLNAVIDQIESHPDLDLIFLLLGRTP